MTYFHINLGSSLAFFSANPSEFPLNKRLGNNAKQPRQQNSYYHCLHNHGTESHDIPNY